MNIKTENQRVIILVRQAIDDIENDLNRSRLSAYSAQVLSDEFSALHKQLRKLEGRNND